MITVVTYASCADTLGRWLAGRVDLIPKRHFWWSTLVRGLIFVILYMLTYDGVDPGFFGADWFVIILLGLFAATCGYWSTIGMKYGSDETTEEQGLAGTIMGLHLTFGITLGSTLAIAFLS